MNTILIKIKIFFLLTGGLLILLPAKAQINSWEIGAAIHRWRAGNEPTGWHQYTNIYGAVMRGRVSLLDRIIDGQEHKFRAGDLFGASFGTGFAKEKINPNGEIGGPGTRKLGTMWMTIDLQAGLQAGFAPVEDIFFGARVYKEFQFPFVVGSDYPIASRFYNFIGFNGRYKRIYADVDLGFNWDWNRAEEVKDQTVRLNLKYLLGDEGLNLGLRLDFASKIYNDGGVRDDNFTAVELSVGRIF